MVTSSIARRLLLLALLPVALLTGPAHAASGAGGGAGAEPWEPVTQPSFTVPAGEYCSFGFTYEPDRQRLEGRVLSRYPDGTVEAMQYRGLLIGTTTNDETGESITRNSSGRLTELFRPDGSVRTYLSHGPVGYGFRAEDDYAQGYYQLGGFHRVDVAPDGTRSMSIDRGPEENICETLA